MKLKDFVEKVQMLLEEQGPDEEVWIDQGSCCGCSPTAVESLEGVTKFYGEDADERKMFPWKSRVLIE